MLAGIVSDGSNIRHLRSADQWSVHRDKQALAMGLGQPQMRGSTFIAAGLQVGAVVVGSYWGVVIGDPGRPPSVYTRCAEAAGLLMLMGIIASLLGPAPEQARYRTAVCMAALLYALAVVVWEPFLDVRTPNALVVAGLAMVPLVAFLVYLVRVQAWLSVAGVTFFVFTGSAMIASNVCVSDAGSGFFLYWTS
jgi:hypothetical protein